MSFPSNDDRHEVYTCAILRPASGTLSGENRNSGGFNYLVLDPRFYWNPGEEITVSFIKPDREIMVIPNWDSIKRSVEAIAQEWENFANIHFTFNDSSNAQVRVAFFPGAGGFSALGTDCLSIASDKPTMSLGWSTDDKAFCSSVLHEFGHVLGCLHEHSSPLSEIQWDYEQVYRFYEAKHGKKKDWLRQFLNHDLSIDQTLTKNGKSVKPPSEISLKDKAFMQQIYPHHSIPDKTGVFYSWQYSKRVRQDPTNTAFVPFASNLTTTTPAVAVGLVQFDMDCEIPLRIIATAANVKPQGFNIQTGNWSRTRGSINGLSSAGATWFKIDNPDTSDFRTGIFDTHGYHHESEKFSNFKHTINFKRAFESPPEVIVWIKGFTLRLAPILVSLYPHIKLPRVTL
ncbi:hypothetical protein DID88_002898 [Monilinia fructigena]|uniref:Peptidase metallopeptidase domain-containing protein n=1 Tax=Monilinia fructigena TaxID=38457 RepID=A0A395INE5_9HELO|nr:hypothetical protein DID88_002898 [Monilinia fructigena]